MEQQVIDQLIQKIVSTFENTYKDIELNMFNLPVYVARLMEGVEVISTLAGADKKMIVIGSLKEIIKHIKIKESDRELINNFVNSELLSTFIDIIILASKSAIRINIKECCKCKGKCCGCCCL